MNDQTAANPTPNMEEIWTLEAQARAIQCEELLEKAQSENAALTLRLRAADRTADNAIRENAELRKDRDEFKIEISTLREKCRAEWDARVVAEGKLAEAITELGKVNDENAKQRIALRERAETAERQLAEARNEREFAQKEIDFFRDKSAEARKDALEEAAKVCDEAANDDERVAHDSADLLSMKIRALKENGNG